MSGIEKSRKRGKYLKTRYSDCYKSALLIRSKNRDAKEFCVIYKQTLAEAAQMRRIESNVTWKYFDILYERKVKRLEELWFAIVRRCKDDREDIFIT